MARISQKTIDLIKDTADIVDVVGEFVPLQATGKNMKGLCPFHNEKTPSFFVSRERQIFNCFGCGEKGNAITFIQKYKHMSFVESLKYLADRYHIELELDQYQSQQKSNRNLYQINDKAMQFYSLNLLNLDSGKDALNYLLNRGLDVQTIQEFNLGYAPNSRTSLFDKLKNEFQPLDLLNVGLINRGERGDYYDLFRNRILFPISDESGRTIAFSGRIFGDNSNSAKYVNTPYTELFSKGTVLYNLAKAIPFIKTKNRIVLMEGYMDVIKAYKNNVKESVCSMGTQLTIDQALKIKEYTENVLIVYDGDRAGREATFKALKLLENAKLNVKNVLMPDDVDTDDYMTKFNDFEYQINNNQIDQYDFVYQMIIEHKDLTQPSEIERCKNRLFDFFKNTSGMIREIYLQKFASDALVNYETLQGDYQNYLIDNRIMQNYKKFVEKQKEIKIIKPKYKEAERIILNYYLQDETYRNAIDDRSGLMLIKDLDISFILEAIRGLKPQIGDKSALVLLRSDLSEDYKKKLDKLLLRTDYEYDYDDFISCIRQLEIQKIEAEIEYLQQEAKTYINQGNKDEFVFISNKVLQKQRQIKKLEGSQNDEKQNY